jgi:hypothetical protein
MNDIQTIQNDITVLQPQINVPFEQLPQKFQDCFDKRITPDLEYFKIKAKTIGHWCLVAAASFWFLATFIQGVAASTVHNQLDQSKLTYNLMWSILPFIALIFTAYLAIRKEIYVYKMESGEGRIGLVIHPEALLVRISNKACFLLPRNWLKAVTVQTYTHGKGGRGAKMVFTDIEGKEYPHILGANAYGLFDHFPQNDDLAKTIRRCYPEIEVRG